MSVLGAVIGNRSILFALFTFITAVLALTLTDSASAESLATVYLNEGQFRVDYLGIRDGDKAGEKTVRYAVTNQGCTTGGTANLTLTTPSTGNGKGKGSGGGGPKEPKCAGMSHFSIGVHLLNESHLLDPPDASGDCINCYIATSDHPECSYYSCLVGSFTPTYGNSGATKFFGLKFSKNRDEDSLPVGKTFIFQFTYQDDALYKEGEMEVLVKPGNQFYIGKLLGPVLQ